MVAWSSIVWCVSLGVRVGGRPVALPNIIAPAGHRALDLLTNFSAIIF